MGQGGCAMCELHAMAEPVIAVPSGRTWAGVAADLRRLESHHVLAKGALRRLGFAPEEIHSPANAMCLCAFHHARHESHRERVPRRLLPAGTVAWAEGLGLGWLLDRCYPKEDG